ncbi:antitoxin [Streptomyces sp. NPDC014006]|uniref:antitoxin n=1 Tax=Streptomyces sp. NPDC014006 TaxID=3364870 RepID=UPI0036FF8660
MGLLDRFRQNKQAQDKGKQMSDAGEKTVNDKTGGKYEDQVDAAQRQAEQRLGMDRDRPDQQ